MIITLKVAKMEQVFDVQCYLAAAAARACSSTNFIAASFSCRKKLKIVKQQEQLRNNGTYLRRFVNRKFLEGRLTPLAIKKIYRAESIHS